MRSQLTSAKPCVAPVADVRAQPGKRKDGRRGGRTRPMTGGRPPIERRLPAALAAVQHPATDIQELQAEGQQRPSIIRRTERTVRRWSVALRKVADCLDLKCEGSAWSHPSAIRAVGQMDWAWPLAFPKACVARHVGRRPGQAGEPLGACCRNVPVLALLVGLDEIRCRLAASLERLERLRVQDVERLLLVAQVG